MTKGKLETIKQFLPYYVDKSQRYLVSYGGRAGRKSWEFARALIIRSLEEKILITCTREFQNSITDSVHRLLSNQIELLGVSNQFEIQRNTIRSAKGSEFIFKGLNGNTIDSLKSLEGTDICWVEEAHSVSEKSWQILIPTIRKPGSQIWISFNPDLETDPVYKRFVLNTPPRTYVSKVSYLDNPDCPQEAIEEANYMKQVSYDDYAHIWLGEPRTFTDSQVFKDKFFVRPFEVDETFGNPLLGADWGFSVDPTTLVKSYIKDNILYVRNEAYKVRCEVSDTDKLFKKVPDSDRYLIRADDARPELISHMKHAGFRIQAAGKWKGCAEDRVQFLRNFEKIIIHPDCEHTAEEFRLYNYKTDKRTGDVLPVLEDKHNHTIDALGYAITPLIKKKNESFVL